MPTPENNIFPFKGLNVAVGYDRLGESQTDKAINVDPYDAIEGRLRGGRRAGLSKWVGADINGSNPIQHLIRLVRPQDYPTPSDDLLVLPSNDGSAGGLYRLNANRTLFSQDWSSTGPNELQSGDYDSRFYHVGGARAAISNVDSGASNSLWRLDPSFETIASSVADFWDCGSEGVQVTGVVYDATRSQVIVTVENRTSNYDGATGTHNLFAFDAEDYSTINWVKDIQLAADTTGNLTELWMPRLDHENNIILAAVIDDLTMQEYITIYKVDGDDGTTLATRTLADNTTAGQLKDLAVRPNDGRVVVAAEVSGTPVIELFVLDNDLDIQEQLEDGDLTGASAESVDTIISCDWIPDSQQIAVVVQNIAGGDEGTRVLRISQDGTVQWETEIATDGNGGNRFAYKVRADHNLQNLFVVGIDTGTWESATGTVDTFVLDLDGAILETLDTGFNLTADTHDMLEARVLSGIASPILPRRSALIAASNGNVKVIEDGTIRLPTNGTNAVTTNPYRVQMATLIDRVFMVDGSNANFYDLDDDEVFDWASEVTAGTLPTGHKLVARYRNRIVLAGNGSGVWDMSASGNPLDFDYSPTTPVATQAVRGTVANGGIVGDLITALIPIGDDALIFGGARSIWQMTGDPAAGGTLDLISNGTGIAFGSAWALDQTQTIYFVGNDGVYRMGVGGRPESLTAGRLDPVFADLDYSQTFFQLAWNTQRKQLWVKLAPTNLGDDVLIYVWDARTDSWWQRDYPADQGPFFLYQDIGDTPNEQKFLMGGRDGIIREEDFTALDDDGTAIASDVRLPMVPSPDASGSILLTETNVVLAEGSSDVTLKVYAEQTAERLSDAATPRFTRTLSAGRNNAIRRRVRGYAIAAELSASAAAAPWALERFATRFKQTGRARKPRS